MTALLEIGFQYREKSEKKLISAINQILSEMFPSNSQYKLTKVKNESILKAHYPFKYTHIYGTLMKKDGIYLDVYPNADINGRKKFENTDCSWVMFVNSIGFYSTDELEIIDEDNPKAKEYVQELLSRIEYHNYVLYNYKFGEERL